MATKVKNEQKEQEEKEVKKEKIKYVAPSTEPADRSEVADYVQELLGIGADFIHCDVMDGIAVPKQTYNEKMITLLRRKFPNAKLDVHLMTAGGSATVKRYIKAKPFAITVQYEFFQSEKDLVNALKAISKAGIKCGISLSPNVPFSYITPYLKYIDLILVMGVKPGAGGQKLIPQTLSKVKEAKHLKDILKQSLLISFDGGVTLQNACDIYEAGADIVVSGSSIYNSFDREYAITALKGDGAPLVY